MHLTLPRTSSDGCFRQQLWLTVDMHPQEWSQANVCRLAPTVLPRSRKLLHRLVSPRKFLFSRFSFSRFLPSSGSQSLWCAIVPFNHQALDQSFATAPKALDERLPFVDRSLFFPFRSGHPKLGPPISPLFTSSPAELWKETSTTTPCSIRRPRTRTNTHIIMNTPRTNIPC